MSIQFRTRSQSFSVDPNTLPGACCSMDGTCFESTLKGCYEAGGKFNPNRTCEQVDCDTGACCVSGLCYMVTKEGCDARGGFFAGKNFDCYSYDCCAGSTAENQACCFDPPMDATGLPHTGVPYCSDLKPCECLRLGGVPRGAESTCAAIDAAGGCGQTGTTGQGVCCVDGNCLSADLDNLFGYTAGGCARLGGYWGGSGSTCNSGTTFDNSWPCSWPTGSCCGSFVSPAGITYCTDGKTFGGCLNLPEKGGSGGDAWQLGATCGDHLPVIGSVNCRPPTSGVCCIPQGISMEVGGDFEGPYDEFVYDYDCYNATEAQCIEAIGEGFWHEGENCETADCCFLMSFENEQTNESLECSNGIADGACCQFDSQTGEYLSCIATDGYTCYQLDLDTNNNIDTVFQDTSGNGCEPSGNSNPVVIPCTGLPLPGRCCCIWDTEGNHIISIDLEEGAQECPPKDSEYDNSSDYISEMQTLPCNLANCENASVGACCWNKNLNGFVIPACSTVTRSICDSYDGEFYDSFTCGENCEELPCCNVSNNLIACGKETTVGQANICIDEFSYPYIQMDEEDVWDEFKNYFGGDYPLENITFYHDTLRCESCEFLGCGKSRGNCCWGGTCIPHTTQTECSAFKGSYSSCTGLPFTNIEEALSLEYPCLQDCESGSGSTKFPRRPINVRASSTSGLVGVKMLRMMNYRNFTNRFYFDSDGNCTDPESPNCQDINELVEGADGNFYPRFFNVNGTITDPPHVFLSWKDEQNSSDNSSRRNRSGTPCVNHNKVGCAPLNERGTCCVKRDCNEHIEDYLNPFDDANLPISCHECLEDKTECECATLANVTECNDAKPTGQYSWTKGSVSCSTCPCSDPSGANQINDCNDNYLERTDLLDD
jgi:hypothetical protein